MMDHDYDQMQIRFNRLYDKLCKKFVFVCEIMSGSIWYFPRCFCAFGRGFVILSGRFLPMSSWQTLQEYISEPTSHWNEPSSKMAFQVLCSRCLAQFGTIPLYMVFRSIPMYHFILFFGVCEELHLHFGKDIRWDIIFKHRNRVTQVPSTMRPGCRCFCCVCSAF